MWASVVRDPEELLTTKQLAAELGDSPRTVERWRVKGSGPPYLQLQDNGPVRYRRADVTEWKNTRRRLSTSCLLPPLLVEEHAAIASADEAS